MAAQPSGARGEETDEGITGRRALRLGQWVLLVVLTVAVLAYLWTAIFALPQWLVATTYRGTNAEAQLNAVTSTRAALLSVLIPVAVLLGGLAAFLTYRESVEQNRRVNGRARIERRIARRERDEARRLRRAEVYADLLSTCEACVSASIDLHNADEGSYVELEKTLFEKTRALGGATDRVRLLGSDQVQEQALKLDTQCINQLGGSAGARPKTSDDEFKRNLSENAILYKAFLAAARSDLALTR